MSRKSAFGTIVFVSIFIWPPIAMAASDACDLVTKAVVEKYSGLKITNVESKDRGAFTSCTYQTDDWQKSVGLIYFPGGSSTKNSDALVDELQKEFERDQAPYTKLQPHSGLGDAAASYESDDGSFHAVVVLSSSGKANGRLVVSGPTHQAALEIAKAALQGN